MWDYDKLFAEGNTIGYLDSFELESKIHTHTIDYAFNESYNIVRSFSNDQLAYSYLSDFISCETYHVERCIQYIVRLDEHGNVVEKLFDRVKDMKEPMPELRTGMFVKVQPNSEKWHSIGVVINDRVIYDGEGWDRLEEITEDIVEVWPETTCGFNCCYNDEPIWKKNA